MYNFINFVIIILIIVQLFFRFYSTEIGYYLKVYLVRHKDSFTAVKIH